MVKLKKPFNYKGRLFEPGSVLPLPPELEAKMVKAGSAEYCTAAKKSAKLKPEPDKQPETKTDGVPDGGQPSKQPDAHPDEKAGN